MTISNQKKNNFYWITVIIILFLLPLVVPNLYQMHLINIICINIIMAIGLNIVKGFAGQVTVAHIGLYAMGAYSSAILAINYDLSFWFALPGAIIITVVAGAIVGVPSFRLQGPYLALATLAFSESLRIYISVNTDLGATIGISNIPPPKIFDVSFDNAFHYYYIVIPFTLISIYFSFKILKSKLGRAFKAIREDQLAASVVGINLRLYKTIAFVISAVYAGLAGSLYAHLDPGFIHPNNFTLQESVLYILMLVIGGIGHVWGCIVGAIFITVIWDLTREYYQYQLIIFGMVMMITVIYFPIGIGGYYDRFFITKKFIKNQKESIEKIRKLENENT